MIQKPHWLKDDAADFWKKHAKGLSESGMLSEQDVCAFSQLCEVWRLLRTANPAGDSKERVWYVALNKQFATYAKQFGLMPRDRKKSNLEPEQNLDDILTTKMETR